jgi:hypothetical protein
MSTEIAEVELIWLAVVEEDLVCWNALARRTSCPSNDVVHQLQIIKFCVLTVAKM